MPRYRYRKYKRKKKKILTSLFRRLNETLAEKNYVKSIDSFLSEVQSRIKELERIHGDYKLAEEKVEAEKEQYEASTRAIRGTIFEIKRTSKNRKFWGFGELNADSISRIEKLEEQLRRIVKPTLSNPIEWEYEQKQELLDLKEIGKLGKQKLHATKAQEKEHQRKANDNERKKEMRVRIAGYEGKTREVAASIKRELNITEKCPYCNNPVGEEPHADHIYPVSKGGNSNKDNMVYICKKCNLRKSDLTLREFILKASLNRDEVEARLESLGKSF